VSAIRFFGILCFSAALYAQYGASPGVNVTGELRSHGDTGSTEFVVEVYDTRTNAVIDRAPVTNGRFELEHVPVGSYSVRLVTTPGTAPLVEEYYEFEPGGAPLVLDLPERATSQPISGLVSLHELEHPVSKKAIQEAYAAQQFARTNDFPKAIAKLEKAIRIDPAYRDAHVNLGVQYTRVGRTADARTEFQKALDIGPPSAPIYADLALISLAFHQNQEAASYAQKALELDPANSAAHLVLREGLTH